VKNGTKTALKELEKRVETLVRLRPSHKELLEFYGAILKEQLKAREAGQPEGVLKADAADLREEGQLPLLQGRDVPVDVESAKKLFRSLCRVAKRENQTLQEGIEKIQKATRRRRIDIDRFLAEMNLPDPPYAQEVSSSLGLNRDILIFLGRASIQPFVEKTAAFLGEGADLKGWSKSICPICGSLPVLSELTGDEGRRMLICSFCGYRWKGLRMVCAFCGTEDQGAHRYLFIEGDEGVRIDVCDKCKKYIKTIDTRETGHSTFPLLEYIGTLHLDILAQEKGYQRGSIQFLEIG